MIFLHRPAPSPVVRAVSTWNTTVSTKEFVHVHRIMAQVGRHRHGADVLAQDNMVAGVRQV